MDNSANAQFALDQKSLLKTVPNAPGVYLFKDESGRVIYIGKAKDLKKRILSYFKPFDALPIKTALMMKKARGLDFILTASENEAFLLESNLVKKNMPRYNIILRDDKRYPSVRLDPSEPYPRLRIARKIKKDGAIYFGPFSSANSVRSTLKVIDRIFQLRKCKQKGLPKGSRPCLNYQIDRCLGPCTFDIPVSTYQKIVHEVKLFLEGRNKELLRQLKKNMSEASEQLDFEKAARIRDQIRAVERTAVGQRVVSARLEDQDIIGLAQKGALVQLAILFVRKGHLVGSRDYLITDRYDSTSEVMEAFLKQYYAREPFIPKRIIISEPIEDLKSIGVWLSELAGKKIVIHKPYRGEKLRLVKMAVSNAESLLENRSEPTDDDLMQMAQSVLRLKSPPRYIEGLDISNLQGQMAVGSIVSFVDGRPQRSGYRNYKIREVDGIDDYGMMAELVSRRLKKGQLPDLFLVDGGKGHLSAVKKVIDEHRSGVTPAVISIAKPDEDRNEKNDRVYIPNRKNPVALKPGHPVLNMLMRIRDEAHRRAIMGHRKMRGKKLSESKLDLIPGIGKKRKITLINHFKDIDRISKATSEELKEVPGISAALAETIFKFFNSHGRKK